MIESEKQLIRKFQTEPTKEICLLCNTKEEAKLRSIIQSKNFWNVFYSGFTNNEAEHYAITLRDELLRENRVKRGTQYARFAFFRTANRLNQYYKTATGQRVAKRVNNGDFPYNVYDANGGIVKPETKKAKKAG